MYTHYTSGSSPWKIVLVYMSLLPDHSISTALVTHRCHVRPAPPMPSSVYGLGFQGLRVSGLRLGVRV